MKDTRHDWHPVEIFIVGLAIGMILCVMLHIKDSHAGVDFRMIGSSPVTDEDAAKWKNVRVQLVGIMMRSETKISSDVIKLIVFLDSYLEGGVPPDEFYSDFIMMINSLKDKDPEFTERFEYIKKLASSPVGAVAYGGSYLIRSINDK